MRFDIAILAAALAAVCPAAQTYQVRDRAEITSLNGDWDFELAGRRGKIRVPGTWETQGWKTPQYGCVVDDMTKLTGSDLIATVNYHSSGSL